MKGNVPVPAGPVAPLSHRWLWWIGPPAVITWVYREIFPPQMRGLWGLHGKVHNSENALRAILAGGGWSSWLLAVRPVRKAGGDSWFDLKPPGG